VLTLQPRLFILLHFQRSNAMAKPNYSFAKRQRDLAKKQKKEEKRLRKAATTDQEGRAAQPSPNNNGETGS
jgi:hypothetical protein